MLNAWFAFWFGNVQVENLWFMVDLLCVKPMKYDFALKGLDSEHAHAY